MSYLIPTLFIFVFLFSFFKKRNVYNDFIDGAKEAIPLSFSLFPYLATVLILVEVMQQCGLMDLIVDFISPAFCFIGIPKELVQLILLRPFSGSGSLTLLDEIFAKYGVDSYVSRCASVLMGSTETVFYVSAVYFANTKVKKTGVAIPIALFCTLLGAVLTCLLCRIM